MPEKRKSAFRKTEKGKNSLVNSIANNKNKFLTSVRKSKSPKGYNIKYNEFHPKPTAKPTSRPRPKRNATRKRSGSGWNIKSIFSKANK